MENLSRVIDLEYLESVNLKSKAFNEEDQEYPIVSLADMIFSSDKITKTYNIEGEQMTITRKLLNIVDEASKVKQLIGFINNSNDYRDILYHMPITNKGNLNLDFIKKNYHDESIISAFRDLDKIPENYFL